MTCDRCHRDAPACELTAYRGLCEACYVGNTADLSVGGTLVIGTLVRQAAPGPLLGQPQNREGRRVTIQTDTRGNPTCAKCGKVMTPQNAKIRPELFLHDACLPEELQPKREPDMTIEQALAVVDMKLECARIWIPAGADLTGAIDILRRVCKAMARIADVEDSLL